jgi:hypothetical protein
VSRVRALTSRAARSLGVRGSDVGVDAGPREFRYVFVVTYGRSGSTLVQGLLNALPRTLVRGENNLYVLHLFRAMASVEEFRSLHLRHHPRASHSAFYGLHAIKPRSFVEMTNTLVTTHLLGSVRPTSVDVLGFKEVLWHRVLPEETEPFFDFLDSAFPDCRFVLNEREHERVIGSGFWQSQDEESVLQAIERVEEIQVFLRRTRPGRTLDLRYELLTSDDRAVSDPQLRALAEFVHGSYDAKLLDRMRKTLDVGHGPFPFGESRNRGRQRGQASTVHDG